MINENALLCPLCGNENRCEITEVVQGGTCWCMKTKKRIPQELLELVPPEQRGESCICQACIQRFKLTGSV